MSTPLYFETDQRGTWVWVVWAISETRAQLAAICSTEAEALRQVENVAHLYPDSWSLHERAPVDHSFGAADLKALHWRSALSGVKRRKSTTPDTPTQGQPSPDRPSDAGRGGEVTL